MKIDCRATPVVFGPGTLRRTRGTRPVSFDLGLGYESRVEGSGIPHLAKNERDVGHPGVVAWTVFKDLGDVLSLLL